MRSGKNGAKYYVFAGPAPKGDDFLWTISQVDNTKYFKIACKGKYKGQAYLSFYGNEQETNQYMYASDNEDKQMAQRFTISPQDLKGEDLRFKTAQGNAMPYVSVADKWV